MALCKVCSTALRNSTIDIWDWRVLRIDLHTSFRAFVEAVVQGCLVCHHLVRRLGHEGEHLFWKVAHASKNVAELPTTRTLTAMYLRLDSEPDRLEFRTELLWSFYFNDNFKLPMELKNNTTAMFDFEAQVKRRHGTDFSWRLSRLQDLSVSGSKDTIQRIKGQLESASTESDEAFEFMEKCIRTCLSQHEQCINRASPAAWYPTRLLDTSADFIKIVSRDQVAANSQYATLSHRWNASVPKLSVQSLREWEAGIPLAALPPTLRDFVIAAQRLGFLYVWVDCLCIIQDGDGGMDWSRESQTMHLVYRNSSCNFSAGWSVEHTGLFNIRDPRQTDQLAITLSIRDTENGEATYRPYLLSNSESSFWDNEVASAPLNTRGWVVQERFLSPRVLHFGRSEVLFECCESASAERYPDGLPTNNSWRSDFKRFRIGKTIGHDNLYRVWTSVLKAYTKCQLTFTSDKLVAISGVARYLQPFFPGCNYIMGVWTYRVERQSMWYLRPTFLSKVQVFDTLNELGPATPFTSLPSVIASIPYRAPSFSWACVDGPTFSHNLNYEKTAVDAVIISYRNNRDAGDMAFCEDIYDFLPAPKVEMRVVGRLNRARLVSSGSTALYVWPQVGDFDLAKRETFLRDRRNGLYSYASLDFDITLADVPDFEARMFYYMVWAGKRSKQDDPRGPWETISCLILALIDPDMGRFRRIGHIAAIADAQDTSRTLNRKRLDVYTNQQLAAEQATIPCWEYNRETNEHTIYVV